MNFGLRIKKTLCTAAAVVLTGGAAMAASPAEIYEEAARSMLANPEGEYVVQISMDMPFMKDAGASVVNTIAVKADPFQVKSEAVSSVLDNTKVVHSYAEQDGAVVHVYYEDTRSGDAVWKKADRKLKSDEPISAKFRGDRNVMAGVKSVTDNGNNAYTVVYDVSKLYQDMDKAQWEKDGYKKEQVEGFGKVLQALQSAGDIALNVVVDPQAKRISRVDLPWTPQIRDAALTLVSESDTPEARKEMLEQLIQNSDISISVEYSALPADADLTAPDEVKASALPGEVPGADSTEAPAA